MQLAYVLGVNFSSGSSKKAKSAFFKYIIESYVTYLCLLYIYWAGRQESVARKLNTVYPRSPSAARSGHFYICNWSASGVIGS